MNFKLKALFVALSLILAQGSSAWAINGPGGSNGGAGVKKDGKLMSFYSAGLYVEPHNQDDVPYSPPQLDSLIKFTQAFKYWDNDTKSVLIQTAIPSQKHQYYKVKEDQFDQTTMDRILAEFSRVTGQPTDGLELFAITDIERGQTFLLPGFYKLENPADQVAILFHENLWLLKGDQAGYQDIVDTELAFQAVYEEPNNGPRIMDLITRYGDQSHITDVIAKIDLDSGALNGLVTNGLFPVKALLGDNLVSCAPNCLEGLLGANIVALVQKYPNSVLLRRLMADQQNGSLHVQYSYTYLSFQKETPVGWIYFPNNKTQDVDYSFEGFLTAGSGLPEKKMNLASCQLNLNAGTVGQMTCDDKDNAVKADTIKLVF